MPRRKVALVLVLVAVVACAVTLGLLRWQIGARREHRLAAVRAHDVDLNVVLISLDTTRADRLGCYGYEAAETHTIDKLAAGGIRFARAKTHVPITLPSHSTVFTGTTPVVHGVHHHSSVLADDGNETLAEILRANGYRTAAFIAASVLNHGFGTDQGFETYADDMGFEGSLGTARVERRADVVLREARQWLDENADQKFFAFIHLYDAHMPYRPPAPYDRRHRASPYDGEIAYIDAELGDFLDYLATRGLAENTLVVVFGDHGESLGEHGIEGHSAFVYETMMWVPLLMSCPGILPAGMVVDDQVRLVDVLPTILDILGIAPPRSVQGVSLLPCALGRDRTSAPTAYIESYHLNDLFGWSPLLGVETERWKYIRAPRPELYDLKKDPDELNNLFEERPEVVSELDQKLVEFLTRDDGARAGVGSDELDAAMIEKLASLGYFGRASGGEQGASESENDLIDPKDVWDTYLLYQRAFVASSYSRNDEMRDALAELYERMPDNGTIRLLLAKSYMAGSEPAAAMPILERDLETSPDDLFLNLSLGIVYGQLGYYDKAETCLEKVLAVRPNDPKALSSLGSVYLSRKEYDRAERMFDEVLALDDVDIETRHVSLINLGMIHYLIRRDLERAIPYFERALSVHPNSADAHFYLAHIFAKKPHTRGDALRHARAFLALSQQPNERRQRIEYLVASLEQSSR